MWLVHFQICTLLLLVLAFVKVFNGEIAHHVYLRELQKYLLTVPEEIAAEAKMTVPELIKHKGYPVEIHKVVTTDGYILTLHRIPFGMDSNTYVCNQKRPVVFLMHGLQCSSADWITLGPEHSLAYLLADNGYDVWMGNFRGNRYSRNHTKLDPDVDKKEFWDFSWHEMGIHDLPNMVDYILDNTGAENLFHVGHSQGTTTMYVMLSEMPEYNSKIRAHFSLSPVAFMKHAFSPICRFIAKFDGPIGDLFEKIGKYEYLPKHSFLTKFASENCRNNKLIHLLCLSSVFSMVGFNPKQFNTTSSAVILGHSPAGAATKQFTHYGQLMKAGPNNKFRQFDYGFYGNLAKYWRSTPPSYHVQNVLAPIFMFYSGNDWLSNKKDVQKLFRKISSPLKKLILVQDEMFNHLDYLMAIDAPNLVYQPILRIMQQL